MRNQTLWSSLASTGSEPCPNESLFCLAQAPSLGSQGTQDSGLGLQYLWPPTEGGSWVYIPLTQTEPDTGAHCELGPGCWCCRLIPSTGPEPPRPDGPSWVLCGSPAAVGSRPPVGGASLHWNLHHRDTVSAGSVFMCLHDETKTSRSR